jgi:hypothetical protein
VFVVICCALIFKTDLVNESLQEDFYDYFLLVSYIILLPASFVLTIVHKLRFVVTKMAERENDYTANNSNISARRHACDLHVTGLSNSVERDLLKRFVDGWYIAKEHASSRTTKTKRPPRLESSRQSMLQNTLKVDGSKIFQDLPRSMLTI